MIKYLRLQQQDERKFSELVLLFNKEFDTPHADSINHENIRSLLGKSEFVCIVAMVDEEVIGGLTGYELTMYDRPGSSIYLYDIAVAKPYQRQGIGSSLIAELSAYCQLKGIREVFVQADAMDLHAIDFYKNLGGEMSEVFHFTFKY